MTKYPLSSMIRLYRLVLCETSGGVLTCKENSVIPGAHKLETGRLDNVTFVSIRTLILP